MRALRESAASSCGRNQPSRSHDPRRSVIHSTLAGVLSSIGMTIAGTTELAREAPRPHAESMHAISSVNELRQALRARFALELLESSSQENALHCAGTTVCAAESNSEVPTLSAVIHAKFSKECETVCEDIGGWTDVKWRQTKAVASYLWHYRMSASQADVSRKPRDCNDDANILCEEMSREFGLPMHLISVWPAEAHQRLDHDWHQFACCRLDDGRYLIMDKHRATLWNGTLEEYAQEHPCGGVPASVIPVLGISEYREPLHDWVASKALLQVLHVRPSENHMRTLQLQPEYAENTLARRP